MIMKNTLTLAWQVREDLPSERAAQYRQLVMAALQEFRSSGDCTAEGHMMIDRMFWDHLDNELGEMHQMRISLRAMLNQHKFETPKAFQAESVVAHIESAIHEIDAALGCFSVTP